MEKSKFCPCGDALETKDGKGSINKNLCWICDMDENPEAYQILE